jgi:hypothetical protein
MAIGIVALAEDPPILVRGEAIGVKPMRRAKTIPMRHGCGAHRLQSFSQE